jgi:hypothetical protein
MAALCASHVALHTLTLLQHASLFASSITLTLQPQLRCQNLLAAAAAAGGAAQQQVVCNGLVQEVEEEDPSVNEDDPNSDPLHPFACNRCGERFNAMKAKDVHEVECAKKVHLYNFKL